MLDRSKRWQWLSILIIFLVALAVRTVAVVLCGHPDVVRYSESGLIARNLAKGRGFTFTFYGTRTDQPLRSFMPPLFPMLIALCLRYSDDPSRALELTQAVLSSLTVVFLYFVALKLSSRRVVALMAGIAASLYPVFVIMSAFPPSLTLNSFLLALFLLLAVVLKERMTLLPAAAAGAALGALLLTRPMALGLFPITIGWLWLNAPQERAKLVKLATVSCACMVIAVLPWTVRNYQVHGRLVLISTNGGFNFWTGNNPFTIGSGHDVYSKLADQFLGVPHDPGEPEIVERQPYPLPREIQDQLSTIDELAMDRMLYQAGLRFIRDNPGRWSELAMAKLKGLWWFRTNIGDKYEASWTRYYKLVYVALLLLVIPGLWLSLRRWRSYSLLYLLFAYYTLVYVTFHVQTRFRWEFEPYLLVFAAAPVYHLWQLVQARKAPRPSGR